MAKYLLLLAIFSLTFPSLQALSLIGHWGFEEGSGTTATNSSSVAGINGTISNATYTTGKVGSYALDFNGSTSYVVFNNTNDVFTPKTLTISLWFKPRASQSPWADILDKGHGGTSNPYYGGYVFQYNNTAAQFGTYYGNGSTFVGPNTTTGYKDDQWHHLVATLGQDQVSLYVDGAEVYKAAGSGPLVSNNQNLYLGRHANVTGRYFNGLIDELWIYDGVLEQSQISALYGGGDISVPEISSSFMIALGLITLFVYNMRK